METYGRLGWGLIHCKEVCEKFHKRSQPPQKSASEFFEGPSLFEFPPRDARRKIAALPVGASARPVFLGRA
jgi:hypothetical protein